MTNHIPKKQNSTILDEFKKTNNPLYQSHFGIALNSIIHWTKDFDNNYIVVTLNSGDRYMFAGTTAKTILYSIGDKDNTRFTPMTHEEEQAHIAAILNPRPQAPQPVEAPTADLDTEEGLMELQPSFAVEETSVVTDNAVSEEKVDTTPAQLETHPTAEQSANTFNPATFGY